MPTWPCDATQAMRSAQPREYGEMAAVKESFGFIKCCDREARLFFHFGSLLDPKAELK